MTESRFADEDTLAHLVQLEADNAKLREELAAAQKDTARLDLFEANPTWLRYHKNTGRPVITYVGGKGEMK